MKSFAEEDIRAMLRAHVARKFDSAADFAKSVGLSRSYVSRILSGEKSIPAAFLPLLGVKVHMVAVTKMDMPDKAFAFLIHGGAFKGMPLSRVAEYMTQLSLLAGPTAIFKRMTDDAIEFTEAG